MISPHPALKHGRRQGGECAGIAQHQAGGIKCAGQVFPTGQVDGGFSTYGAVHHGQEGGWDLEVGNAPEVCGGGKACQVAGDAAAQSYEQIPPGDLVLRQNLQDFEIGLSIFGGFSLGKYIGADQETSCFQGSLGPLAVQGRYDAVADQGSPGDLGRGERPSLPAGPAGRGRLQRHRAWSSESESQLASFCKGLPYPPDAPGSLGKLLWRQGLGPSHRAWGGSL